MLNFVLRLYAILLRLYPRGFCEEFGDEMYAVFSDALAEAAKRGGTALIVVCWREICDLPLALARACAYPQGGTNEQGIEFVWLV
jgi:hypothetical protein